MTRYRIDISDLKEAIEGMKEQIGEDLVEHYKTRITRGSEVPLKEPRPDGSTRTPLFRTGRHLRDSIQFNLPQNGNIEVGSTFKGAKRLFYGGRGIKPRKYLKPNAKTIETIVDTFKKELGA